MKRILRNLALNPREDLNWVIMDRLEDIYYEKHDITRVIQDIIGSHYVAKHEEYLTIAQEEHFLRTVSYEDIASVQHEDTTPILETSSAARGEQNEKEWVKSINTFSSEGNVTRVTLSVQGRNRTESFFAHLLTPSADRFSETFYNDVYNLLSEPNTRFWDGEMFSILIHPQTHALTIPHQVYWFTVTITPET